MSCKKWLTSAARQCQTGLAQQQSKAFSTSAPVAAFRSIFKATDGPSNNNNNNNHPSRGPNADGGPPSFSRGPRGPRRGRSSANANEALHGMVTEGFERGGPLSAEEQRRVMEQQHSGRAYVKDMRLSAVTESYLRQMPRRWMVGDVYAPHDMGPSEMAKWRRPKPPTRDVVDVLGFNPLDNYRNFSLISEFITPMGRIKHSSETGLRPVNQRKMAKAIRRAIGMGLYPSVHKHPEILRLHRQVPPSAAIPDAATGSQLRL